MAAVAVLLGANLSGCYLSHERPRGRDGGSDAGEALDARVVLDAADASDAADGSDAADASDAAAARDAAAPLDACVGDSCAVAEVLDGLRWELPCTNPRDQICDTLDEVRDSVVAGGEAGARYAVTLRFRGVVETARYDGGTVMGRFVVGGEHYEGAWNLYALEVTSPPQTYFLNGNTEGDYFCVAIDYTQEILLDARSRVQLVADAVEGRQIQNLDRDENPIVIPGVAPFPDPYDGQFVQMDVVSVRRVR